MKIKYITILNILIFSITYAQNKNTEYLYSLQTNGFESYYNLKTNGNISLWSEIEKMKIKESSYDYSVSYIEDENYTLSHVYKNLKDPVMLSNIKIIGNDYYITEKMTNLNWEIIDGTEKILNFNCQIAKTKYKGRSYRAFFTTELPYDVGPWKFQGLPGMILKVQSTDFNENYIIECIEIRQNESIKFENIYKEFYSRDDFVSWDNFVININNFLKKHIRFLKSKERSDDSEGGNYLIKLKNYLEIFNKEAQTEGIIVDY